VGSSAGSSIPNAGGFTRHFQVNIQTWGNIVDFIKDKIAQRLGGSSFGEQTEIYKFERIKRLKKEAAKKFQYIELIDMGVGEPDTPASAAIVSVLNEESGKANNRFYSDNGILEFQTAAAEYMKAVFNVSGLEPAKNIIHGIGTKPILAMLPMCLIDPGDFCLVTTPGYPILGTHTKYLGGEVYNLPLYRENDFYPDFDSIPEWIFRKSKVLYINYPNNPTGQVATREFFQKVVNFARRSNVVVVHDAAYAALTYDGEKPLSFLSTPGALDVGVEIQSLSKAFCMTGWRLGFLVGNEKLVTAYGTIKDNTDSGQFRAIQKAGVYALNHPEITESICVKYSRRLDILVQALNEIGFDAIKPKGSFYCYVPMPAGTAKGIHFQSAQEAAEYFIINANISVVPWDDCGGYLRFSVTFEADDSDGEIRVITELKKRFESLDLIFE
jgi:LL-diaminopimelate aminotransferase